ncbi:MAG: chromosome partitioning protein [Pseudonocardiales bacterium]|nr:MAG: chromosome partitioning protein [Pseudonocardiales bacterium]
MTLPILTAVTDASWEADLVAGLAGSDLGVTVVRRCVDVADLLAAAAARTAEAVVLSADLRRLDRAALAQLASAGVAVVALVEPGDEPAERRLRQLGVGTVLATDAGAAAIAIALQAAVVTARADALAGPLADPLAALPRLDAPMAGPALPRGGGRIVAIWGPTGAPGRTTVAVGLADEASRMGVSTMLVDADTYGGSIGQVLGFLDESPGLAAATRLAGNGRLDLPALAGLARGTDPWLRVLTGIVRADRWPELSGDAVEAVLDLCRRLATLVVVDCGFSLEQDEEIVYDTAAPRRNAAALAALTAADTILVVGAADPVGMHRLIRGLAEFRELAVTGVPRVVVNKLRRGVTPGDPATELAAALRRHAGVDNPVLLPYDRTALDRAIGVGKSLADVAPGSALRRGLTELAAGVAGVAPPSTQRSRRRVAAWAPAAP